MTNQRTAHAIAVLFTPLDVGTEFSRRAWPAHITVVGNFFVDDPKALIRALCAATSWDEPIDAVMTEPAMFGAQADVPALLASSPRLAPLHAELAAVVEAAEGFAAVTPEFWHDGYRPHVTLGTGVTLARGDRRSGASVVLAALEGSTARIAARFDLPISSAAPGAVHAQPGSSVAEWLRALPTIPPDVPDIDVESLPTEPLDMLLQRLRAAVAAGVRAPQAMTLTTTSPDGPRARTVILKDVSGGRVAFATHAASPKAEQLLAASQVALVFFWPDVGDQIRIEGDAVDLGDDASSADFSARGPHSRASALIGSPSQPLDDRARHSSAFADALERASSDPDLVEPLWRAYGVTPTRVELWHSSRAGQVRVNYLPDGHGGWVRGLLWP